MNKCESKFIDEAIGLHVSCSLQHGHDGMCAFALSHRELMVLSQAIDGAKCEARELRSMIRTARDVLALVDG